MEFEVTKCILANQRRWDELIRGCTFATFLSDSPVVQYRNLFSMPEIRTAWKSLEYNFCAENVKALVEAINRYSEDAEETVVYRTIEEGKTVEAVYYPKRTVVATGQNTTGISVIYTLHGDLYAPERYEFPD